MANVANKYKLGAFVLLGSAVLLAVLFILGFMSYFERKVPFMTVVTTSVQGLTVGAKVKYRGVPIGTVTDIKISPIDDFVLIYMEAYPSRLQYDADSFAKTPAGDMPSGLRAMLDAEIQKGLRCQLRYEGITGNLYQEILYFDPRNYPPPAIKIPPGAPFYIPSAPPILVGNILETINESLTKISRIEFNRISRQFIEALDSINKYLDSDEISTMLAEIKAISVNVNGLTSNLRETLTKERIDALLGDLSTAIDTFERLSNDLRRQLDQSKIPETTESARRLMDASRRSLDALESLRDELSVTAANFNETLDSIDNLARGVEADPNSLIWGKNAQKVVPSE